MSKNKRQALLLLAGVFCTGAVIGAAVTSLVVKAEKPAAEQEPLTIKMIMVEPEESYTTETEEPVEEEEKLTSLGEFKLTAYCPCEKCCGQWADGITYTGTQATEGRTVAVDPGVIPLGSTVLINGTEYIAEDVGGAIKGNRIDVYFDTHQAALHFGVQYAEVSIK